MAKLPDSIDKYKIESLIARGGMGAVYKGLHPTLKRPVILKKLTLRGGPSLTERFRREARILMDFRHDHIVDVYDHFKLGGSYYIVLEFVDGESLEGLIKKQRYLDSSVAAMILLQTAIALNYAHSKHVIHRDIKPANILISKAGEVKLVDFGIAVSAEDSEDGLTREGMTLGTPSYMAPEQFQNTKNVDKRADIYSLGVMLYEALTGKKPFIGGFSPELINQIQKGKYKSPRTYNPKIDRELVRIIKKLMHYNPKRRFQSLEALIVRLKKYLNRFDQTDVKEKLIGIVRGEKKPRKVRLARKTKVRRKIRHGILAAILAASVVYGLLTSGVYYEMFKSGSHGKVLFRIEVPVGSQPLSSLYVKGTIFHDDNDMIPEIPSGGIFFLPDLFSKENKHIFFALPRYLPEGPYRAKIVYEDQVYWESFLLYPRTLQRSLNIGEEGQEIVFSRNKIVKGTIDFDYRVMDAVTAENLGDSAVIKIKKGAKWIVYDPSNQDTYPVNGAVNIFSVQVPGYHPQTYSLFIAGDQDACSINAKVYPLSWRLGIKKPKAVDVTLNGYPFYYSGTVALNINRIEPAEELTFSLPEGSHTVEFIYRDFTRKVTVNTLDLQRKRFSELSAVIDKNSVNNPIAINKK